MIRPIARVLLPLFLVLAGGVAVAEDNWPEFRGPHGDGHADAAALPLTWSETEHVRWKTAIHDRGWSSPVIWGDQIWLTTATQDGKQMFAVQVDRKSGAIVRDILVFSPAEPAYCIPFNSYASCTPAIEQGRVYIHFGAYGTTAFDTATGEKLWVRQDLPCDHFRGPGSSPILWHNLLILTFDGFDLQYLVALDKRTGDTVWRTDRNIKYETDDGDYHKAFSTPTVIRAAGREQLISPSAGATIAYDPATGRELWRVQSGGMNAAARPLFGHGLVFATTAYQRLSTVRRSARWIGRHDRQPRRLEIGQKHSQPQFTAVGGRSDIHGLRRGGRLVRRCQDRQPALAKASARRIHGLAHLCPGPHLLFQRLGQEPRDRGRGRFPRACRQPTGRRLHGLAGGRRECAFLRSKTHLYRIEQ